MEDQIRRSPDDKTTSFLSASARVLLCCFMAALTAACGGGGGGDGGGGGGGSNNPPGSGNNPPGGGGNTPPPDSGSPPGASAPTIATQPQPQRVATGDPATFTVAITSSTTLSYQWRKNGADIAGANAATYTTAAVGTVDSGSTFTVVGTNSGGTVTSDAATLTAYANPEGIFSGTLTQSGTSTSNPLLAFVLKDGTTTIFVKTGEVEPLVPVGQFLHVNAIAPDLDDFSSTYKGYTQVGETFPGGLFEINGTLTGVVDPAQKLTGTYTSTIDSGTFEIQYESAQYEQAASGAIIAGTYSYKQIFDHTLVPGDATFNADGTWSGHDLNGCTFTGTYTVPDPARNVYKLVNDEVCSYGTFRFTGLATFFAAGTGAVFNGGVNFTTDTVIIQVDNLASGYMVIAHK